MGESPPPGDLIESRKGFKDLVGKSHKVLFTTSSIFPLEPIPDKLIIDENKINVIHKEIFFTYQHSALIEDITDVYVNFGLLSASLFLTDSSNIRHPIKLSINHLWKKEAQTAQRIILGLVTAKKKGIHFSPLAAKELVKYAIKLGSFTDK